MKAVDTNLLVRVITGDDAAQAARAVAVLADGAFVSLTVLLECEWVLRSRYRFARARLADVLDRLLYIDGVHVADESDFMCNEAARRTALRPDSRRFPAGADRADSSRGAAEPRREPEHPHHRHQRHRAHGQRRRGDGAAAVELGGAGRQAGVQLPLRGARLPQHGHAGGAA